MSGDDRIELILDEEVFYGLPESYAIARQPALEKEHGCKLRFLHVRMGGSIWHNGDPRFNSMPTVALFEKAKGPEAALANLRSKAA